MKSRVWGGIFIIAGTTIGAGMLAFPIVGLRVGVTASLSIMVCYWLYMLMTAVLASEIVIRFSDYPTIPEIVGRELGCVWSWLGAGALLLLFGSLMVAYTVSGASVIHEVFRPVIILPESVYMIILTGLLGGVVVNKIPALDTVNRHLFFLMIVALGVMSVIILRSDVMPHFQPEHVPTRSEVLAVIPVLFTTFGFQGSIPVIIKYVGAKRKDLWLTFGLGSFIPLLVYLLWQHVALDGLSDEAKTLARDLAIDNVGPFLTLLQDSAQERSSDTVGALFAVSAHAFSFFAIVTSYIGVGLTLRDYLGNVLGGKQVFNTPLKQFAWVSGVPLIAALVYPHGFIGALGFAGFMLLILAVILPGIVYMKMPGKRLGITLVWIFILLIGLLIGGAEVRNMLG